MANDDLRMRSSRAALSVPTRQGQVVVGPRGPAGATGPAYNFAATPEVEDLTAEDIVLVMQGGVVKRATVQQILDLFRP